MPLEPERDLYDNAGNSRSHDGLVGAAPPDPCASCERRRSEQYPHKWAWERSDQSNARTGHQCPPGSRGAEPSHKGSERGDEDEVAETLMDGIDNNNAIAMDTYVDDQLDALLYQVGEIGSILDLQKQIASI